MKIGEQPTYPCSHATHQYSGMTYRQWLIGMALQGIVGSLEHLKAVSKHTDDAADGRTLLAYEAIKQADAVIAAMDAEGK